MRRGWIMSAAAILATSLSGCAGGVTNGDDAATLSTGDWTPGDDEVGGVVGGVLGVNDGGCLYLPGPQVGRGDVIWPSGYASKTAGDTVSVLNHEGQVVAETGKPFAAKGLILTSSMFAGAGITDARRCHANTNGVTVVIGSELPPLAKWYTPDSHVVTLYHCGVNPTQFEGRVWVVPEDQLPLDGQDSPKSFVGRGTMVEVGQDKALYVDESGVRIVFRPRDMVPGRSCA